MAMTTVIVLGASGMLGSMVTDVLSRDRTLHVIATARSTDLAAKGRARVDKADWRTFEIRNEAETTRQIDSLGNVDWMVNAIGIIKPYIHDDDPAECERAILGNAMFPHWLARAAEKSGAQVLQIATDCVYSGVKGHYVESDKHDALDVYGKTKSLGEVSSPNIHHLRCSIIGPEPKAYISLLEWFLHQPSGAEANGFSNHLWNGVTTLHFANLCRAVISGSMVLSHIQHIVPTGEVTKNDLLHVFAQCFGRDDIRIRPVEADLVVNRTLLTENESLNLELWQTAGYHDRPPTVPEMIQELAAFNYQMGGM